MDQPFGIDGVAAHHFQGRGGAFFADGDARDEEGIHGASADHIADVEHVVVRLLRRAMGCGNEGPREFGIRFERGHGNAFSFRIAQSRKRAAIDATRVDVDRVVEPFGPRHGRMPIDDSGRAAIPGGPIQADGQAKFVGLARGLAIEGKGSHRARCAPDQFFFHPRVCHDEIAAVERVMADETVEEIRIAFAIPRIDLRQRIGKAIRGPDPLAPKGAHQAGIVIPGHAQGRACLDHVHDEIEHMGDFRTAVHQVPQKDGFAPRRRCDMIGLNTVTEFVQQRDQFVVTPVDVADDVKRPALVLAVRPNPLAGDAHAPNFGFGAQRVNPPKPLALEAFERAAQLVALMPDHMPAKIPVGPRCVALATQGFGHVQYNRDRENVVLFCQCDEGLARAFLNTRGVDHRQLVIAEAFARDKVQGLKCLFGDGLVRFVVAEHPAKEIRGQDFGAFEVGLRKRGFPRARRADEDDEGDFRDCDVNGFGHSGKR